MPLTTRHRGHADRNHLNSREIKMSSLEKTMTRLSSVFAARPRRRKNARGQTATEYLEPRVVMSATALSRVGQLAVGSALTSSSTTRSTGAPSHVADVLRAANTVTATSGGDSNDQMREAFNLGAISSTRTNTTHSISSSRDVDMFKFTVTGGQTVRFDIDHPSTSRLDSYIRLFDASGRQLRWSNNAAAPGESLGRDSYLQHTFSTSGTYYLGVSGAGNTSYSAVTGNGDRNGSTGSFNLTVSPVNTVTPPGRTPPTERFDSEPNNSSAQADFIGSFRRGRYSRTYYGSTGSGSDTQDWIRIRLEGRTTGSINLTGMYQDLDLRVYDSTGRLVGASLNGGARTDFVNLRNAAAGDY